MTLPTMALWARLKGLSILSSSDYTHPLWMREMQGYLEEYGEGLYRIKHEFSKAPDGMIDPLFLLSTEISSIYKQGDKLRRIHNLLFVPSFEVALKINSELSKRGCNLNADGRPIIGLSSENLLELALTIDKRCILIPCHVWTPHFGVYGSASGFDSLEEAFGKLHKYVYGIETGLSSDPVMNWQIPELKNRSILSFSDAHSPAKMGREVTVFEFDKKPGDLSYMDIGRAICRRGEKGVCEISYSLEFYPEEGKYHYTGHRNCNVVLNPKEIKEKGDICPVCKRKLVEGVLYRVEQLAPSFSEDIAIKKEDGMGVVWSNDPNNNHPPFVKLVPLNEIIAEAMNSTVASEKVKMKFKDLCTRFGNEIKVLIETPIEEIASFAGSRISEGVLNVRKGTISVKPGYDGLYGVVHIFDNRKEVVGPTSEITTPLTKKEQMNLF